MLNLLIPARRQLSAIYDCRVLVDEEEDISPTLGIFLSGCNLRCRFCLAQEFSACGKGLLDPESFAACLDKVMELISSGKLVVRTISFIGGEPSLYLREIHAAWEMISQRWKKLRNSPGRQAPAGAEDSLIHPVSLVLNTNMVMSERDVGLYTRVFDYVVADLKFGNDTCARLLTVHGTGEYRRYWELVTSNILRVSEFSKVIVRHLVLPGHFQCCTAPILKWVKREAPDLPVNLMLDYYPTGKSGIHGLERTLTTDERDVAIKMAEDSGIHLVGTYLAQLGRTQTNVGPSAEIEPSVPRDSICTSNTLAAEGIIESPTSKTCYTLIVTQDGTVIIPDLPQELTGLIQHLKG